MGVSSFAVDFDPQMQTGCWSDILNQGRGPPITTTLIFTLLANRAATGWPPHLRLYSTSFWFGPPFKCTYSLELP
jgi:hypothetical protein